MFPLLVSSALLINRAFFYALVRLQKGNSASRNVGIDRHYLKVRLPSRVVSFHALRDTRNDIQAAGAHAKASLGIVET